MAKRSASAAERKPAAALPVVTDEAQARALKLYVVLSRASAAVNAAARRDIARHGLTTAEFGVAEALYHLGPMLLNEVQRKILVSSGGMTYLVDRLEKRGIVERRGCPEDRRAIYAALTPEGERFMASIFPDHAECITKALTGLSEEEQRAATMLLKKLGMHAAGADCSKGSGPPDAQ
jgi:MarR family transcriptional regulator, 2-MHQ and catechol-resistance regulon repressor